MTPGPSAFDRFSVNGVDLEVIGELPSDKHGQKLVLLRYKDDRKLLARCLQELDPELLPTAVRAAASVEHEKRALASIDRPELPKVYPELCGPAKLGTGARYISVLALVRDYIEGWPIDKRLREMDSAVPQIKVIISWLEGVARALIALHSRNVGHFDLRASNVIHPEEQGRPVVVIDLNSSQILSSNKEVQHTILRIDQRLAPDEWYRHVADKHGRIDLESLGPDFTLGWLDWYQFGLLIRELLEVAAISTTNRRYLEEVAAYLTQYPACAKIESGEIRRLLERAKPEFLHPYGVPELVRNDRNTEVEIFPDKPVLTKVGVIADIVKHPAFTRLFAVKQLTLLKYVFCGAEHTRAMHMMHCASITADLMQHLFSEPRFRRTFESQHVRFAIVAALLHDINHFPFLHTFQESANATFSNRALFDDVVNSDFEYFTGEKHPPLAELLAADGIDPESIWRVCFARQRTNLRDSPVEQFVQSMLDAGIDVDKLSYLWLDAWYTGVPVGLGIDYSRLMRSAIMTQDNHGMEFLAFDMRALPAVEAVIHARLANFRAIYWHPRNRSLMTMFLHVADSIDFAAMDAPALRREFLVSSEEDVVKKMNRLYLQSTGRISPMAKFVPLRGAGLYEELYQVPFVSRDDKDGPEKQVFDWLSTLSRMTGPNLKKQLSVRRAIAERLSRRYPRLGIVDEAEVLVDVPSREMDGLINAYLRDEWGKLRSISEVSSTAKAAASDFQRLAKSIRVFVAPRIADKIGLPGAESEFAWMGHALYEIIADLGRDEPPTLS